jgi:hypothetical protein
LQPNVYTFNILLEFYMFKRFSPDDVDAVRAKMKEAGIRGDKRTSMLLFQVCIGPALFWSSRQHLPNLLFCAQISNVALARLFVLKANW